MSVAEIERKAALKHFAERLDLWTPPFKHANVAALKAEYVDALGKFDAATIRWAYEEVRDDWSKTSMPPVGLFVAAAKKIRARSLAKESKPQVHEPDPSDVADDVLMNTADGRQAISEGWWYSLWSHVFHHGKYYDFAKVRERAEFGAVVWQRIDALNPADADQYDKMLIAERKNMLDRMARLQARLWPAIAA